MEKNDWSFLKLKRNFQFLVSPLIIVNNKQSDKKKNANAKTINERKRKKRRKKITNDYNNKL